MIHSPGDFTPLYGWLIRGLAGVINMLSALCRDDVVFSPHFLGELEDCHFSLTAVVEKQKAMRQR